MKLTNTFFILFCFLLTYSYTDGQTMFHKGSWAEIQKTALKENKYILLDGYTQWCGFCKLQDEEIFAREDVGSFVNDHFIATKIDMEQGIGPRLAAKFRVWIFPTLLFFNPQGQLIEKQIGYNDDPTDFLKSLQEIIAIKEEKKFAYDSQNLDVDFPFFYKAYFDKEADRPNNTKELAIEYLHTTIDIFSEQAWSVMTLFEAPEKISNAFLEHYDIYKGMYGNTEAEFLLRNILLEKIHLAAVENNEDSFQKWLSYGEEKIKDNFIGNELKIQYYTETKNWKAFVKTLDTIFSKKDYTEFRKMNQQSWEIYEVVDDPIAITKALSWMEIVIEGSKNYNYWDTYTALLYKDHQYDKALSYADITIKLGIAQQTDVSVTKELREMILLAQEEK